MVRNVPKRTMQSYHTTFTVDRSMFDCLPFQHMHARGEYLAQREKETMMKKQGTGVETCFVSDREGEKRMKAGR